MKKPKKSVLEKAKAGAAPPAFAQSSKPAAYSYQKKK
jgi:hypothetical protein